MVASNPLWVGSLNLRKFRATVINDIWPEVTFFTLVATAVTLVTKKTDHSLAISSSLLTVLGTVLGLVISFRTSTAYERYQEGRKIWTTLALASRNLGHMIWNHVDYERDAKHAPVPTASIPAPNARLAAVIEKKSMLNLVHAFAVSVKHLLRGEPGIYYEDLYPLVCFLPRFASAAGGAELLPLWQASELYALPGSARTGPATRAQTPAPFSASPPAEAATAGAPELPMHSGQNTLRQLSASDFGAEKGGAWMAGSRTARKKRTFDPEQVLPQVESDRPLLPARNPPKATLYDYLPFLRIFKPLVALFRRSSGGASDAAGRRTLLGHKKYLAHVESNVPLEITLFLSSYLSWLLKKGLLTPALAAAITANISTLQECSVNLQRIRNTPLPFAYQAHLRMSLWLYLLFLPFQIQASMGWITIPGSAFASFLLLGFLEIGQEIENPFNYDENDLDLDGFCLQIQRELAEITAHTVPAPDTFLFSAWNQPFAPADRRTAEEILRDEAHAYHANEGEEGMDAVRRTLLRSWRDVDAQTREHYSGWSAEGQ